MTLKMQTMKELDSKMPYLLPLTFVSFQLKSIYYFLNFTILKKKINLP